MQTDLGDIYQVEEILERKNSGRARKYLIKWKGYPLECATWEPIENLENIMPYLIAFNKEQDEKNQKKLYEKEIVGKKVELEENALKKESEMLNKKRKIVEDVVVDCEKEDVKKESVGERKKGNNEAKIVGKEKSESKRKSYEIVKHAELTVEKSADTVENKKEILEQKEEIKTPTENNSIIKPKEVQMSKEEIKPPIENISLVKSKEVQMLKEEIIMKTQTENISFEEEIKTQKESVSLKKPRSSSKREEIEDQELSAIVKKINNTSDRNLCYSEGSLKTDIPKSIAYCKNVKNKGLFCLIIWKKRSDNIKPDPSYVNSLDLREKYSNMLLDFYEKKLSASKKIEQS